MMIFWFSLFLIFQLNQQRLIEEEEKENREKIAEEFDFTRLS